MLYYPIIYLFIHHIVHIIILFISYIISKPYTDKVDARNDLESGAYSLKTQINDKDKLGAKLNEEDKATLQKAVDEAIEFLEKHPDAEVDELKEQKKTFDEVVQPITSKLYQGQEGGQAPPPPAGEEPTEKEEL